MIMTIMMRTGAVLAAMGVCCLVAFELIGSTVDEDGTLHEPFGLIPIGLLLFGVAAPSRPQIRDGGRGSGMPDPGIPRTTAAQEGGNRTSR